MKKPLSNEQCEVLHKVFNYLRKLAQEKEGAAAENTTLARSESVTAQTETEVKQDVRQ